MPQPTPAPAPDVNNTDKADENLENAAENKSGRPEQKDQADVGPTDQPPQPLNQGLPTNTDKGVSG